MRDASSAGSWTPLPPKASPSTSYKLGGCMETYSFTCLWGPWSKAWVPRFAVFFCECVIKIDILEGEIPPGGFNFSQWKHFRRDPHRSVVCRVCTNTSKYESSVPEFVLTHALLHSARLYIGIALYVENVDSPLASRTPSKRLIIEIRHAKPLPSWVLSVTSIASYGGPLSAEHLNIRN